MANIIKLNKMPRCYLGAVHIWCPGTSSLVLAINDFVFTPCVHDQCDCIHGYSISPCQMPFWNMCLEARTKQWAATELTKMLCTRSPCAHISGIIFEF